MRHPVLGVPICRSCKYFYEDDGEWEKDEQVCVLVSLFQIILNNKLPN